MMAALVGSGMPLDRFTFFGFIPRKGKERTEAIADIVRSRFTAVLFEAANRVGATLTALAAAGAGERKAVVARELTKQFEEFRRGTISELARACDDSPPRGEVALVIAGAEKGEISEGELIAAARTARAEGLAPRDITEHLIKDLGAARNVAYRIAHGGE